MFGTFEVTIDSIQQAKSKALSALVVDEKIRKPLQNLIDAETAYAKTFTSAFEDLLNLGKNFKFDTFKFNR
jgi:hypothetical protein